MFSQRIVESSISRVTDRIRLERGDSSFRIVRMPADVIAEMVAHLDSLIDKESGNFTRDLTAEESRFIENELILSQLDFQHFAEHHCVIQLSRGGEISDDRPEGWAELDKSGREEVDLSEDGMRPDSGGILGKFVFNGMQLTMMAKIAELEEKCFEAMRRGAPVNGILLIVLKARQLGACLVTGTRVLTADLRWIPIEEVKPGDRLVAVDEDVPGGSGAARKMREAVVQARRTLIAPATRRVVLSDGRTFTATPEHRFLCKQRGGPAGQWRNVGSMLVGDSIRNLTPPWLSEPSYEDGWFAGIFDGEGSIRAKKSGGSEVCISQVAGPVLERASRYLTDRGYSFREEVDNRKSGESSKLGNQPVFKYVLNKLSQIFRIVGRTRPSRFVGRTDWWAGKEIPHGFHEGETWVKIVSIEQAGEQRVFDLQTSTGTFIAEGLVSHNSMFWQAIMYHRTAFFHHINGLTASMNDKATQRLHRRYKRIHENLPRWMRPTYEFWPKDRGVTFDHGSMMELQDGRQGDDLGKGEAWHAWHVTEASIFPRPEDHFDEGLFPATAYGMVGGYPVIAGLETTAKGKIGWFHDFFLQVKSGTAEGGSGRFDWSFSPFYLIDATDAARGQRSRYRLEPPVGWEPNLNTRLLDQEVKDTSAEYTLDKLPVTLHRDVLYWYESTRAQYYRKGKLNLFLQNYPITWEEAFQHSAAGAFTSETIERLDRECSEWNPWPYRLIAEEEIPLIERSSDMPIHHAAGYHLGPMDALEVDRDARGIVWLWEHPDPRYAYQSSCDPTGGIPGWQRAFRQQNDVNTDNGVIEIFRKGGSPARCEDCNGRGWLSTDQRDVQVECEKCKGRGRRGGQAMQVAEFAAPIDPEELALYCFVLGRLFVGSSDMDECPLIVESNNTGLITIRKLQNTYRYSNLYQHRSLDGTTPKYMNSIGWHSSAQSVPVLHARSRLVIMRRDVELRSRWMVKELSDAVIKISEDSGKERFHVPPGGGRHDDRMTSGFLALWAMFDWSELDGSELPNDSLAREMPVLQEFARTDATAAEQQARWNDAADAMFGKYDLDFGHFPDCDVSCTAEHAPDDDEMSEYELDELEDAEEEDDLYSFN